MGALFIIHVKGERFGSYRATFQSTDGEEYIASYGIIPRRHVHTLNPVNQIQCRIILKLEWTDSSSKFITVTPRTVLGEVDRRQIHRYVPEEKTATFNVGDAKNCCFIVVEIASHMQVERGPLVPLGQYFGHQHEESSSGHHPEAPPVRNVSSHETEPTTVKGLDKLSSDLENILQSGKFCDIVLTDGSVEIKAHKVILCARSSVFAKMLQNKMKEANESRILLEDVTMVTLKELLRYMYTGTVTLRDNSMAQDMYVAADKYDMKDLKKASSEMLQCVNLDNVLDTLRFAKFYDDEDIKKSGVTFIIDNYSEMKNNKDWDAFVKQNPELAIRILTGVIDKRSWLHKMDTVKRTLGISN